MARKKIEDGYKTPQDRYRAQNIKRMEIKLDIKTDGDILGSIIKVGVITKRKTNDSQTDKVSLTRKHTGGESLVRERVYNRTAEIGRRPD